MNFDDGTAFLALAKELVKQAVDPLNQNAKLRSAISRAYFAAFLAVRYYLRYIEGDRAIPRSADAHRYVKEKFANSNDKVRQDIAYGLESLREERNKADYNANYVVLLTNIQLLLYAADEIFASLKTL